MAETFRSDGNAVDVIVPKLVNKGDPVYAEGFHGIAMASASSGNTVSLEIQQREHELVVGGGVSAAKGAVLYLSTAGVITNTTSDKPFLKVTLAKDSNNVVWGILLPQGV
jgi:predicted RecA/RadA family phage recombinase